MTVPGPNITITSRLLPDGEVVTAQTRRAGPVDGIPQALANINALPCPRATACIYCGSKEQLSDEHVVPYALGGHLQILDGSCEVCRKGTSEFENRLLNDGAMANIRKALGLQSRSKHKSATDTVDVVLVRDGGDYPERLPAESVPQVFGFPQFAPPHLLTGADERGITLQGWVAASTGPDVDTFLREYGATAVRLEEDGKQPVAFAQAVAKIAYCCAWSLGILKHFPDTAPLVHAFLQDPSQLGAFVGTKSGPYEKFVSTIRITFGRVHPGWLCAEVQFFADIGMPIYQVVLGRCETARAWRRIRATLSTVNPSHVLKAI